MKLFACLAAAACLACSAAAQTTQEPSPTAQSNVPDMNAPRDVVVKRDGRCMDVRPGDVVHYTLTIEGLEGEHTVYGDLRLHMGGGEKSGSGLPVPDFKSLGGGGLGARDQQTSNMFGFAFKVPVEIYGGIYRGTGVNVRADEPFSTAGPGPSARLTRAKDERVDVTRHTRDEVRAYCLNVISNFGVSGRPEVTDFKPGSVDPQPAPLPGPQGTQPPR